MAPWVPVSISIHCAVSLPISLFSTSLPTPRLPIESLMPISFFIRILRATAGFQIEQPARKIRIKNFTCLLVFDLVHATQRTAIAERLPFFGRHLGQ